MRKFVEKICNNCFNIYKTRNHKQLCCNTKCSNIYQANIRKNTILDNGKSLSEIYSEKSANKLKENGWYSSDKLKIIAKNNFKDVLKNEKVLSKLKETNKRKKEILDENGFNLFQLSTQKALKTKEKKSLVIPIDKKTDYEKYKYLVWRFTNKNNLTLLDNFKNRIRSKKNNFGYQLDHVYSIFDGFTNKVPPEIIGHISNLQFILWEENLSKNNKSKKSLKQLFIDAGVNYYEYYEENYVELKKSKNSAYVMNTTKKECSKCGIITTIGNYSRWHEEKCTKYLKVSDILKGK